ncbi:MAG: purine-nucleoside phosphorylase [Spirochaetales bacterium]|jgi:purine-nucleoside phosphorylase|nr:purine-nucleoside phosphorylase [Spirochaetales bacterium]
MSIHIGAKKGDIAETILLPGDPLRARFVAENFLENPVCYNEVRGMYGYTGTYKGSRISVQGSGMGMPTLSIYVHELINDYGVKNLMRIGSCGSLQSHVEIRDVLLAQCASTDSSMNRHRFEGMDFAPGASFDLLYLAYENAKKLDLPVKVGNILSEDTFYSEDAEFWKLWAKYGVLAVEMETSALYTLAARFGVRALSILTVSDNLVTNAVTTSEEREKTFTDMMKLALDTASSL